MAQAFKDVPVGGKRYRIGLLCSSDGGWIYAKLTEKMRDARLAQTNGIAPAEVKLPADMPPPKEVTMEEGMGMTAAFFLSTLSRKEMAEVQAMCMEVVDEYQAQAGSILPMPIMDDGRWLIEDLRFSGPKVLALTKEAIVFNIMPFFTEAGLSEASQSPADPSSSAIPA